MVDRPRFDRRKVASQKDPRPGMITGDLLGQLLRGAGNLVVNGGFEVWQRGVGPFTTLTPSADRWSIDISGGTASVTRIASTIGSKGFSAQYVAGAGTTQAYLYQKVEGGDQSLAGKTVTFACKIKSTNASTFIRVYANGVSNNSPMAPANTETDLSVTVALGTPITDQVQIAIVSLAAGTIEINDARLVVGATVPDFVPLSPADDLARCQRYYETGFQHWTWFATAVTASCFNAFVRTDYSVEKGGTPTVTLSNVAQSWVTPSVTPVPALPVLSGSSVLENGPTGFTRQLDYCAQWNQNAVGREVFNWTAEWNP